MAKLYEMEAEQEQTKVFFLVIDFFEVVSSKQVFFLFFVMKFNPCFTLLVLQLRGLYTCRRGGREGGEGKVPEGNGSHLEIGITFHLQKNKTKKMKIIPLYERYLSLYFDRLGKKKKHHIVISH